MTAMKIGEQLVSYCKAGKNLESINTLYAENVESVEAQSPPGGGDRVTKGIEGVRGKNQWWMDNHEVHESSVEGPWPHGENKFAVRFTYELTHKPSSQRMKMDEIGVFSLENNKVVREEFFYTAG